MQDLISQDFLELVLILDDFMKLSSSNCGVMLERLCPFSNRHGVIRIDDMIEHEPMTKLFSIRAACGDFAVQRLDCVYCAFLMIVIKDALPIRFS